MGIHFEGYNMARADVYKMSRQQLIDHIMDLFGFEHLFELFRVPIGQMDDMTLRAEALRQTEIEFRDPAKL